MISVGFISYVDVGNSGLLKVKKYVNLTLLLSNLQYVLYFNKDPHLKNCV